MQVGILVRYLCQHFLVQRGFAVAHTHLADQQRTHLAYQPVIRMQPPRRMGWQISPVKPQQRGAGTLPDTILHSRALGPVLHQRPGEPGRIHPLRTRKHQVQLQLFPGRTGHFLPQRTVRWQLYVGIQLLLKMNRSRIA